MAYCNHHFNKPPNEALNQAITAVAPKTTCYSGSISLYSHISLVIGRHNLGWMPLFQKLCSEHNMTMLSRYLDRKDNMKGWKRKYQRKLYVKMARSQKQKKHRQEVFNECTDNSYGVGVGLNAGLKQNTASRQTAKKTNSQVKRCKCGSDMHSRTTHQHCPLNKKKARISNIVDETVVNNLLVPATATAAA
jgi:hypothetical protein